MPHIDQLFDEEVLIGTGWTTKESLRPLAYSTLADLVHHVRTHLPLPHLSLAVHMFSKNVHDDSLPVSIQTMSCKVGTLHVHDVISMCVGSEPMPVRPTCPLFIFHPSTPPHILRSIHPSFPTVYIYSCYFIKD